MNKHRTNKIFVDTGPDFSLQCCGAVNISFGSENPQIRITGTGPGPVPLKNDLL
jgi:hypothetical protein